MKRIFIFICLLVLISGCMATTSQISPKLNLGMTKQEVIEKCGKPFKSAATIDSASGESIESLTYREYLDAPGLVVENPKPIFINIYFRNGKVVQYGEGMDWKTFADYEGERKIKITTDENMKAKKK